MSRYAATIIAAPVVTVCSVSVNRSHTAMTTNASSTEKSTDTVAKMKPVMSLCPSAASKVSRGRSPNRW